MLKPSVALLFPSLSILVSSHLKDWEYLLPSNYHRQMNSQPTCGPLDMSFSSSTDAASMSSVSPPPRLDGISCSSVTSEMRPELLGKQLMDY